MMLPIDPAVYQQLAQAVQQCGVSAAETSITYADYLQGEEIVIKARVLDDNQINCLLRIQRNAPYPIVSFESADVAKRSYELQHQEGRAAAREWLEKRSLLNSLPSYDPKSGSISDFARRIEAFCGIEPGSMLTMHELGILTFKSEWAESQLRKTGSTLDEDKIWCLMNTLSASNLEEHGVRFGFIGNEAYSIEEPQK